MVEVRLYPKPVSINISTVNEKMLLSWIFLHHDYDEVAFGATRIKSKWFPCENGEHYKNGEHGKYMYDITYPTHHSSCRACYTDIELDEEAIMEQFNSADKFDYDRFSGEDLVVGAKYNRKDPNIAIYTEAPTTQILCELENPIVGQDGLAVYFECDDNGGVKYMKPVVAKHSNIVYTNVVHVGCDEASDADIFHLTSKADPGYVVRIETDFDDIIDTVAFRLKLGKNGMLFHE